MKAHRTNLIRWTICNFIACFWLCFFVWVGFTDTLNGTISSGSFTASFFLAYQLWFACETIGSILEKLFEYGNGIDRLVQTLRIKPESMDKTPAQDLPQDWSKITLNKASYIYEATPVKASKTSALPSIAVKKLPSSGKAAQANRRSSNCS